VSPRRPKAAKSSNPITEEGLRASRGETATSLNAVSNASPPLREGNAHPRNTSHARNTTTMKTVATAVSPRSGSQTTTASAQRSAAGARRPSTLSRFFAAKQIETEEDAETRISKSSPVPRRRIKKN